MAQLFAQVQRFRDAAAFEAGLSVARDAGASAPARAYAFAYLVTVVGPMFEPDPGTFADPGETCALRPTLHRLASYGTPLPANARTRLGALSGEVAQDSQAAPAARGGARCLAYALRMIDTVEQRTGKRVGP